MKIHLKKEILNGYDHAKSFIGLPNILGGGMHVNSTLLWAYLFSIQNALNINGNLMEIGVFEGYGSFLPSKFKSKNEKIILIDINLHYIDKTKSFLVENTNNLLNDDIVFAVGDSNLSDFPDLEIYKKSCRWIHIDGEHSYSAVINDLNIAKEFINNNGIICVDDVDQSLAPCINDAMLDWLNLNKEWKLLIRGYNKAFIISNRADFSYEEFIKFIPDVFSRYYSSVIMLASQTSNSSSSYYSYGPPFSDFNYLKVNNPCKEVADFEGFSPRLYLIGASSKPIYLLFGNCQMRVLHKALVMAASYIGLDIDFRFVNDVQSLSDDDVSELHSLNYAGLITQRVKSSQYKITSDLLESNVTKDELIIMPSMYFDGYWPNHGDLKIFSDSDASAPVDMLLYKFISDGLSTEEIYEKYLNLSLNEDNFNLFFNSSLKRLYDREISNEETISLHSFLTNQDCRSTRLFYIFNHPKKQVFNYFCAEILKLLSNFYSPKYEHNFLKLCSGLINLEFDMSSIDFLNINPMLIVKNQLKLKENYDESISRYSRERFSNDVYTTHSLMDEVKKLRILYESISNEKKENNLNILNNSSLNSVFSSH